MQARWSQSDNSYFLKLHEWQTCRCMVIWTNIYTTWKTIDLLLLTVASLVISHISLRSEAFAAHAASERSLVVMYPLVNFQVLLLWEPFATRGEGTTEWLRTIVNVLVCLEPNASFEALTAALIIADEYLLICRAFFPSALLDRRLWSITVTVIKALNDFVLFAMIILIADQIF